MKNSVHIITHKQFMRIKNKLSANENAFVVTVEGASIQSWDLFLDKMINEFKLPMKEHRNVNAYLDWMRDLDWLDKDEYALFIKDYRDFMKEDLDMKKILLVILKIAYYLFGKQKLNRW